MDDALRGSQRGSEQGDVAAFSRYLALGARNGTLGLPELFSLWSEHRGTPLARIIPTVEPRHPALSDYTSVEIEPTVGRPITNHRGLFHLQQKAYHRYAFPRETLTAILSHHSGSVAPGHESLCARIAASKGEWYNVTWKREHHDILEERFYACKDTPRLASEQQRWTPAEPTAVVYYQIPSHLPSLDRVPLSEFPDDFVQAHYGVPLSLFPASLRIDAHRAWIVLPQGTRPIQIARIHGLTIAIRQYGSEYDSAGVRGVRDSCGTNVMER